jgi:hypothetical protein
LRQRVSAGRQKGYAGKGRVWWIDSSVCEARLESWRTRGLFGGSGSEVVWKCLREGQWSLSNHAVLTWRFGNKPEHQREGPKAAIHRDIIQVGQVWKRGSVVKTSSGGITSSLCGRIGAGSFFGASGQTELSCVSAHRRRVACSSSMRRSMEKSPPTGRDWKWNLSGFYGRAWKAGEGDGARNGAFRSAEVS